MKKVAIIDYGMGNLRSVYNAFVSLGICSVHIAEAPDVLKSADFIVLPGVGAFGDGIKNLESKGFVHALDEEVRVKGKPFLGICLGMQLLATIGMEYGQHRGFNWIPGVVDKINNKDFEIRLPHIGWNDVNFTVKDGLFSGLSSPHAFYFVHTYVLFPENQDVVSSQFSYGREYAASIENGNIYATQFHPEKSHKAGLKVLNNFLLIKR